MSKIRRIEIIAPPFGGHLHPQLDLASRIQEVHQCDLEILSTPSAVPAIEKACLPYSTLLSGRESVLLGIANAPRRVGSNPFRLLGQLRDNVSLMDQLVTELTSRWESSKPDLLIADFAVPVAGLLAKKMGIRWWTAMRAPTVIDTSDGVPPYMGGWSPRADWIGRTRDAFGRTIIRLFKKSAHLMFRKQMLRFGISSVYRPDGWERIYSSEQLLVQGVKEMEFPCTWPTSTVFVGPMTRSPSFDHAIPKFVDGKVHVLVTLGTHVLWAKARASDWIQKLAHSMPHMEFHFTRGASEVVEIDTVRNAQYLSYLPYDEYLHRYQGCIHHAGSGIMYSCLRHGIPALALPQDFDQFDNAARMEYHGVGIRVRPQLSSLQDGLARVLSDQAIRRRCKEMKDLIAGYPTNEILLRLLTTT